MAKQVEAAGVEFDEGMMADVGARLGLAGMMGEKVDGAAARAAADEEQGGEDDGAAPAEAGEVVGEKKDGQDDAAAPAEVEAGEEVGEKAGGDGAAAPAEVEAGEDAGDAEIAKLRLPPNVAAAVNRRIGKITREKKEAQEALAEREAELETLQERAAASQAAAAVGVHPLLAAESEADIEKREGEILSFRKWARKNPDGGKFGEEELGAFEMQERLAEMDDELLVMVPRARKLVAARARMDAIAVREYPNLADRKSPDRMTMESVFAMVPGLRALPNAKVIVGDMIAGEKLRLAKAKAKPAGEATPRAPRVAIAPADAGPARVIGTVERKKERDWDAKKFVADGGDRSALVAQIDSMLQD